MQMFQGIEREINSIRKEYVTVRNIKVAKDLWTVIQADITWKFLSQFPASTLLHNGSRII